MKVKVYSMNGAKAVAIPAKVMRLLGFSDRTTMELDVVKEAGTSAWEIRLRGR